jgi:hypothetical protein
LKEQLKENKKGCMPFCHSPRSYGSEMVSIRRSRVIGEKEIGRVALRGQKKKR